MQWEITMAEALSDAGYATSLYGKWHLGSRDGRVSTDLGIRRVVRRHGRQDTMVDPSVKNPLLVQ